MAEFERYIVLCTHFSLTVRDRIASVGIILDVVENIEKPVFLAGDMNDTHNTEMQRRLMERFTVLNDPEQATLGSGSDERCVDYIYGLDNGALWSALGRGVIPETVASDHRPVWVDVRLTSNAKP